MIATTCTFAEGPTTAADWLKKLDQQAAFIREIAHAVIGVTEDSSRRQRIRAD